MSNQLIPIIEKVNEEFVVSSRVIAEQLGKQHKNVLQELDAIIGSAESSAHPTKLIKPSAYVNQQNKQTYREYLLTEDGFTLYMFNIQGYQDFKLAYIHEFRRLRELALNPLTMLLACSKEQLALTALQLTETVQTQNQLILEQKPKVEVYDQIVDSKSLYSFKEAADLLNIKGLGRNNLIDLLRQRKILSKSNEPKRIYIEQGYFESKASTFTIKKEQCSTTVTKVTGKGVTWLTKIINKVDKQIKK